MHLLPSALLLCCASALVAQTYIVDAANGPGTNFTDLAAAVAAVPDGAKLDVRAGTYAPFTILGKGLSVFCASGVALTGGCSVGNTTAAQTVVVRGVQSNLGTIQLVNCQGPVVVEHCSVLYQGLQAWLQLDIYDCPRVHVTDCAFGSAGMAVQATNSTVTLRNSSLRGPTCVAAFSSAVDLVDCVQQQVNPGTIVLGAPGMFLQAGSVRLVGGSVTVGRGPCFSGSGTVRVDPSTILAPGNTFPVSTVPLTTVPMPAVVATDGPLGGVVTTTMRGPVGDLGGLLVGLPGAPWPYPGIADSLWLQPGSYGVCALTVFAVGTNLQVTYGVPNVPAMRGLCIAWQGVTSGATNGLQASNPAITTHW